MAHESFEDKEVADYLNKYFVAIKVDKEERPDVDTIYMAVCQKLTNRGGWPLSIFMTYDQKPFYAGTYFPKKSHYNLPGFMDLLHAVKDAWDNQKEDLIQSSEKIIEELQKTTESTEDLNYDEMIEQSITVFKHYFDAKNGGFGNAPKFPSPHNLFYLLHYAYYKKDKEALEIVEKTLDGMYRGGIFDHIGYGFSRYSTDDEWLVPHFEKMLYDNGLLAIIYLEAYQYTKNKHYAIVADKIFTFIERELTHEEGGFYCALDADSEGEEGKFYVFTPDEIIQVLGTEDGEYFNDYFGITKEGNFEGKNIPNRIANIKIGQGKNIEHNEKIEQLCQKVYQYREKRMKLHRDDKILTSWNSIMIVAYAKAYAILGKEEYLERAKKAVNFIEKNLAKDNRLAVSYREGVRKGEGNIDDYAFYCYALLSLYEASFEVEYLEKAINYCKVMIDKFLDSKTGGFYFYAEDGEQLIYRPKEIYDGAIPSGNAVATYCLWKLGALTGELSYLEHFQLQLEYYRKNIDHPMSHSFFFMILLQEINPTKELVCVHNKDKEKVYEFLREEFRPEISVVIKTNENKDMLSRLAPFTKDYEIKEEDTYYLCEKQSCLAPVKSIRELKSLLNEG